MFKSEAIYQQGQSPRQYAQKIDSLLSSHTLVHCKEVGYTQQDLFNFYEEVSSHIGECVPIAEDYRTGQTTGEKWIEIRFDPSIKNAYRHSKEPQPLHTDGSYMAHSPSIFMMFCMNQAVSGGATTFIEGKKLILKLKSNKPELYHRIVNTPICFSKANNSKKRPIITFDHSDNPIFTWNYYCVDPSESDTNKSLVKEFHQFLQSEIVGSSEIHEIILNPGDAVLWHDERLLHGRNGFEANKSNDRFLWKTAINRSCIVV